MQVKRVQKRAGGNVLGVLIAMSACGLLTASAVCVGLFIFRDAIIGAGMTSAGFEEEGRTEDIFQADAAVTPLPQIVQPQNPPQFSVSVGQYGQETITNNAPLELQVGQDDTGQQLATVTANEADIVALCQQVSNICSPQGQLESGYLIRNATIDLKNGGAIVYADLQPEGTGLSQRTGLVMQLSGDQLMVRGVDVNGTLYGSPPAQLEVLVDEAQRVANEAIRQLVINAQGAQYDLESIAIDEDNVTVLLR